MKTINEGFENVPIQNLKMHPRNVNQGDFGAIQESIEENGFAGAITANRRTGHIIDGNHRYKVAKHEGVATVPVIWVDVDEERELRLMLAFNRTTRLGHDDENALAALLSELALTDGGLSGTGFDGDDLDDLIGRVAGEDFSGKNKEIKTESLINEGSLACPRCGFEFEVKA
jgi:ParB-like chromosome segregation protein Spo0J